MRKRNRIRKQHIQNYTLRLIPGKCMIYLELYGRQANIARIFAAEAPAATYISW